MQMFNPQLKIKPYRSEKYKKFVRSKPCVSCNGRYGSSQAHHVRRSHWGAGTAIKPHDFVTIPLCFECHNPETEKSLNVELIIIDLLMEYITNEKISNSTKPI